MTKITVLAFTVFILVATPLMAKTKRTSKHLNNVKGVQVRGSLGSTLDGNLNITSKNNSRLGGEVLIKYEDKKKSFFEIYGHLIISGLSTLLTIVVVWITSKYTFKSAETSANTQREIAEKAHKIETLSRNRQNWIIDLRAELSLFISKLYQYKRDKGNWDLLESDLKEKIDHLDSKHKGDSLVKKEHEDEEVKGGYEILKLRNEQVAEQRNRVSDIKSQVQASMEKIILLLNPQEEESLKLITLIEKANKTAQEMDDLKEVTLDLRSTSQKILKSEWEKVKSLK